MYGGPSQVDLFDPKPELTKRDGQPMPNLENDPRFDAGRTSGKPLLGSLWEFTKHGQSGIEVSSLFPKLAECVDDMAIIRSCHADSFAHGSGLLQMNTGSLRQGFPEPGLVGHLRPGHRESEPAGVRGDARPSRRADRRRAELGRGLHAGHLPGHAVPHQRRPDHRPLAARRHHPRTSSGSSSTCWASSTTCTASSCRTTPNLPPGSTATSWPSACSSTPPRRSTSAAKRPQTLERYGLNNETTEKFGRRCLMARRLVERGVRFVQVYSGGGHLDENWDAHRA